MTAYWIAHLRELLVTAAALFAVGLHCILASRNLIRILVGIELLTKAVTLLLVSAGAVIGRMALAQALVVTLIVLEVVVIVVAAGIVVGAYRETGAISTEGLHELKG